MKKLLSSTRLALRESNDMARLLTLSPEERSLVVYAEDTFTYVQLKGYLQSLWADHGLSYHYITSAPADPMLENPPDGATVWFVRDQMARLMGALTCGVFLTTMPDLGKFHIPRPKAGKTSYAFHSLNSTHTAYRNGAFDNYDQFLCTGPHHVEELTRLRTSDIPQLSEVGYYKLDLIRREHEHSVAGDKVQSDLVLLAPSWGAENLLEAHGTEIVRALLSEGMGVIVRPHPQFFHSLYRKGREVVETLQREFGDNSDVEFELSIDSQDSFHRSALMISDWSGAAYEYALGTMRPVLFIDTPQKIFNPDWKEIGLPSFESVMRSEVGSVVPTSEVAEVGHIAVRLLSGELISPRQLADLAQSVVFNPLRSAQAGAGAIAESVQAA
jgi:hypothetical protein